MLKIKASIKIYRFPTSSLNCVWDNFTFTTLSQTHVAGELVHLWILKPCLGGCIIRPSQVAGNVASLFHLTAVFPAGSVCYKWKWLFKFTFSAWPSLASDAASG